MMSGYGKGTKFYLHIINSTWHVPPALFRCLGALYDEEKLVHRLVGALRPDLKDPNA
jgi:hypothetical protein